MFSKKIKNKTKCPDHNNDFVDSSNTNKQTTFETYKYTYKTCALKTAFLQCSHTNNDVIPFDLFMLYSLPNTFQIKQIHCHEIQV